MRLQYGRHPPLNCNHLLSVLDLSQNFRPGYASIQPYEIGDLQLVKIVKLVGLKSSKIRSYRRSLPACRPNLLQEAQIDFIQSSLGVHDVQRGDHGCYVVCVAHQVYIIHTCGLFCRTIPALLLLWPYLLDIHTRCNRWSPCHVDNFVPPVVDTKARGTCPPANEAWRPITSS